MNNAPDRTPNWVQRYLDHIRVDKRLAPRTLTLYALHLAKLQQLAADCGCTLAKIQSDQVRRWVMRQHSRASSPRTMALTLSAWRGFYAWLAQHVALACNPAQGVRLPRVGRALPKALPVDQAVRLAAFRAEPAPASKVRASPPAAALALRDAAVAELLYSSGLRVAELVGLDAQASSTARGWVDCDAALVHVLGKGGKRRTVPVGAQALAALRLWLSVRDLTLPSTAQAQTALFTGLHGTRLSAQAIWQRLRQHARSAGLDTPVHPHMLRHSFASHLLQSSGDIRAVQELLGHAHISTTQIYTQLDFQHLAQAYDAAHPRARRPAGQRAPTRK